MKLDPKQTEAVNRARRFIESEDPNDKILYIAGPAGSGKTTIMKEIAKLVGGKVCFGAYTGKAASVLRRKGCEGATTIHKLFYRPRQKSATKLTDLKGKLTELTGNHTAAKTANNLALADQLSRQMEAVRNAIKEEERDVGKPMFDLNFESEAAEAEVVFLDEVSMIGKRMGQDILSITKKVIVTGDPHQLPPVGEGGYFTDRKPDVLLDQVHRQGSESPILELATDIRMGRGIHFGDYGKGCRVIPASDERTTDLCLAADQMIVGTNSTRFAANAKHRELRGKTGDLPVVGDKIICLKNNHEVGLLNGTLWRVDEAEAPTDGGSRMNLWISSLDDPGAVGRVPVEVWTDIFKTGEKPAYSNSDDPECFDFGYAITCHKSQGSEFPIGYVYDQSRVFRRDARKWLYTACTRFSEDLTLVIP